MGFKNFIKDYDVVVWDWNGTLLNDLTHTHQVIATILQEEGLAPITIDEYKTHFGFPISNYYASIGLPSEGPDFDRVAQKFIHGYKSMYPKLSLFDDTLELLEIGRSLNVNQYVLSAANIEHLKLQLDHFNLNHYFNQISGANDIYAHGKIGQAKVMKKYFDEKAYVKGVYVGDTDHDFEVSQVLGFDFCFSAGGHQHLDRLDRLIREKISFVLRP